MVPQLQATPSFLKLSLYDLNSFHYDKALEIESFCPHELYLQDNTQIYMSSCRTAGMTAVGKTLPLEESGSTEKPQQGELYYIYKN